MTAKVNFAEIHKENVFSTVHDSAISNHIMGPGVSVHTDIMTTYIFLAKEWSKF